MSKTETKLQKILKKYKIDFSKVENLEILFNEIRNYFGKLPKHEENLLRVAYTMNF